MRLTALVLGVLGFSMVLGGCQAQQSSRCNHPHQEVVGGSRVSMADMGDPPAGYTTEGTVLNIQSGLSGYVLMNARLIGGEGSTGQADPGQELELELGRIDFGRHTVKVDVYRPNPMGELDFCGVASKDISVRKVTNRHTGVSYYEAVQYWLVDDFTPLKEGPNSQRRHSSLRPSLPSVKTSTRNFDNGQVIPGAPANPGGFRKRNP